jgi:UDP:flavonoid glycosyltransferase YjiC (YdhE family)
VCQSDKFRSVYKSPVMPLPLMLYDWVPKCSKRTQLWIADRFFFDRALAKETNGFRAELGLPPVKRFLKRWWLSPQRVIGLFPDWFGPPQPDWPPQTVLTGFPLWDQSAVRGMPEHVARYLDDGDPPVVFTYGTANQHARRLYTAAVEACQLLGRRGLIMTKYRELLPSRLPDCVRHCEYVPFSLLLRRTAAVAHHAGTGTSAQCLAAGVPQLLTPIAFAQPDVAAQLVRLGVGRTLRLRSFRAKTLAKALDRLLVSESVKRCCRDLASRFEADQNEPDSSVDSPFSAPVERACDALEELAGTDGSLSPP